MIGLRDRLAEGSFEFRLVGEPLTDLLRRAVEHLQERHVVLDRIVRRLGLGQQVLGEEVVDRLGFGGLIAGLGFGSNGLVALVEPRACSASASRPLGVDLGISFAIGPLRLQRPGG